MNMNHSLSNKDISISGKIVITDWRGAEIVPPENLQDSIKANEAAKEKVREQKAAPKGTSLSW